MPDGLQPRLEGRDLVVFDGVCVLCSGFFRFLIRFDKDKRFAFATAQSPLGQDFYRALGLPGDEFETNLVIVDGQVFQHLDAFAAAMRALGGVWAVLGWVAFLPAIVKKPLYSTIARNRYRIFGKRDQCMMPEPEVRARFVAKGF